MFTLTRASFEVGLLAWLEIQQMHCDWLSLRQMARPCACNSVQLISLFHRSGRNPLWGFCCSPGGWIRHCLRPKLAALRLENCGGVSLVVVAVAEDVAIEVNRGTMAQGGTAETISGDRTGN